MYINFMLKIFILKSKNEQTKNLHDDLCLNVLSSSYKNFLGLVYHTSL